jgi:hypothetical protein
MAEKPGPQDYAPPGRRMADHASESVQLADTIAGEIRQLVRKDGALASRPRTDLDSVKINPAVENLNAHVERVAGMSMEEIDRVIRELEGVRDMLQNEGQRVTREIASYASLSHAATTAMRVIAESIKQWKDGTAGV